MEIKVLEDFVAVELKKGQKISLEKKAASLGEIIINLNWNQGGGAKKGFLASLFGGGSKGIDLDLGCLYELSDGSKGCVQALGNAFGNYRQPPYIALDGDDRTGESAEGENLRVNGDMIASFKRILVYTFIYEGVPNWQQTDGIVTLKYPGSNDIIIRMDEYGSSKTLCAIALMENVGGDTFSIQKLAQFYDGQEELDRAFGWGMRWTVGSKD